MFRSEYEEVPAAALPKYKGFQVVPAELEALLLTHPGIADAAVIGFYNDDNNEEKP